MFWVKWLVIGFAVFIVLLVIIDGILNFIEDWRHPR